MNCDNLYQAALKMLNDKYKITEYPKEKFISIFNNTYLENNINSSTPNNEINKIILVKIKNDISNINEQNEPDKEVIIESKLKELENIRASMNLLSPPTFESNDIDTNNLFNNKDNNIIPNIQITNQNPINNNTFKTFIINTSKNNFKVTPNINIKNNLIYPCCICLPYDIKKITPYILLSISDGLKNINYTYINTISNESNWDIWKPITDNYNEINLNNNWIISLIDYRGNNLDFNHYYYNIIDVLENNNTFSININNNYIKFQVNDKIKIIKENGTFIDNIIVDINNNKLIIKKNKLIYDDFINSSIYNYNNNISLLFKYQLKH
jgi:hypothetical protein